LVPEALKNLLEHEYVSGSARGGRRRNMTEGLLRDLVAIPEEVHAGDFVFDLAVGIGAESTITEYVVTGQIAACFDQALGLIKSAVQISSSRAA
jgi:hypothetical protein